MPDYLREKSYQGEIKNMVYSIVFTRPPVSVNNNSNHKEYEKERRTGDRSSSRKPLVLVPDLHEIL